jgi:hypothetical protein
MKRAYQCDYCGEHYLQNKELMIKHELGCSHNPKNRTCDTCAGWTFKWMGDDDGMQHGCTIVDGDYKWQANCEEWEGK